MATLFGAGRTGTRWRVWMDAEKFERLKLVIYELGELTSELFTLIPLEEADGKKNRDRVNYIGDLIAEIAYSYGIDPIDPFGRLSLEEAT